MAALAVIMTASLGGCSMIVDPEPGPPPRACGPGDTNPCRCSDASYGVQYCDVALGSYGGCRNTRGALCDRGNAAAGRGSDER